MYIYIQENNLEIKLVFTSWKDIKLSVFLLCVNWGTSSKMYH